MLSKGCVGVTPQLANAETVSLIQAERVPQYEIGWSPEHGWRIRVAIHNSVMYLDQLLKVFEACDSPEHALRLGEEWVKEILHPGRGLEICPVPQTNTEALRLEMPHPAEEALAAGPRNLSHTRGARAGGAQP